MQLVWHVEVYGQLVRLGMVSVKKSEFSGPYEKVSGRKADISDTYEKVSGRKAEFSDTFEKASGMQ